MIPNLSHPLACTSLILYSLLYLIDEPPVQHRLSLIPLIVQTVIDSNGLMLRLTDPCTQMTGLNPKKESILSIACFVTDAKLNLLEPDGFEAVIHHSQSRLDHMDDWCTRTHRASGLSKAVVESKTSAEEAARDLCAYIERLVPEKGKALLAGNSVHADKMFLMEAPWGKVLGYLHYRILDVSAIKEGVRRWCGDAVLEGFPKDLKKGRHEAKADILESMEEAGYYMGLFERMA